jgi:hypothetical protein
VVWPDDAPIIRAHDLGHANRQLYAYYAQRQPNRMVYHFDRTAGRLSPPLGNVADLAQSPTPPIVSTTTATTTTTTNPSTPPIRE